MLSIPGHCSNLKTLIDKLEAVGDNQLFQDRAYTVTLTLVSSTSSSVIHSEPRTAVITNTAPRTGVPQPTILPPRHDQQVRPAPSMVATPARPPASSGPRPALPIQLPTQPLPPESDSLLDSTSPVYPNNR